MMEQHGISQEKKKKIRRIPSKDLFDRHSFQLCGREEQQQQLLEAYRRRTTEACAQEMVLITGASGTGKTVLAQSLKRRVEAERGYFCWGKCDQMHHCNEPFGPFVSAITQLIETILKRDDTGEETIRLEEAMEKATQDTELGISLLCGLFRVFKRVRDQDMYSSGRNSVGTTSGDEQSRDTSERSSTARLSTNMQRPRCNQTGETPAIILFCKFLKEFSSIQHPIVMLLDDWQWLDPSSLDLLKVLGSKQNNFPGLMILGTCRGNEVSIKDPLSVVLRALEEQEILLTDIQLNCLSIEGVQDMMVDLLPSTAVKEKESIRPLAELIHQMTKGNPFFVKQRVRVIYQSRLIDRNPSDGSWHWDAKKALTSDAYFDGDGIDEQKWEDATLKLLDAEIRTLADQSSAVKETLVVASFLGARFSLRHVEALSSSPKEDIQWAVKLLEEQGILLPNGSANYRWSHDRFQQSANSIIPSDNKPAYSVNMGRQLLAKLSMAEIEEQTFLVANLFLEDLSLVKENIEKVRVANCLHLAGQKAAESSAFESAAFFFSKGMEVLPNDSWKQHFDLCLLLHNEAMEMAFCNGDFDSIDHLFDTVLANAEQLEDQMRAYETKLSSLSARLLDQDAVVLGFRVLRRLGVRFPRKATKLLQVAAVLKILFWLKRSSTEDILKIQPIQRWDKLAALRILLSIPAAIFRGAPDYQALWAAAGVEIAIKYGFSGSAPVMFTAMGMVLATCTVRLPKDGKRFVDLGQMIDQRYHAPEMTCRIMGFNFAYVQVWHTAFHECKEQMLVAAKAGMLSGDVELAYICASFFSWYGFLVGTPIHEHVIEMERLYKEFSRLKQQMAYMGCPLELGKRLLESDQGAKVPDAPSFGTHCDKLTDEDQIEWGRENKALLSISCMCQLFMAAYLGDYEEGLRVYSRLRLLPYDETWPVALAIQIQFHFGFLEILATQAIKRRRWRAGLRALRRIKRFAQRMPCEENILNNIYLLEAERAVLKGDKETASKKYLSSIQHAEEFSFLHEAALAHERFALALAKWGDQEGAVTHKKKAAVLYQQWGFHTKAMQLTKEGP